MKGYTGKILSIDLSTGCYQVEAIPDKVYEEFLSGLGLGVYYLYRHIPAGCDPLGPDNILGFVSGLLTGTGSLMTGRWLAVCKSPLTGGWGDANCGGTLSPAIKRCGFDAIFIRGQAEQPVFILVENEVVSIHPAEDLWGKDAIESEEILLEKYKQWGKKASVAVIGAAGEKMSLLAGICNSGGRIAARSGVGAVMGSKNLKALVLCGNQPITASNPQQIKKLNKHYTQNIRNQKLQNMVSGSMFPTLGGILMGGKLTKRIPGMLYAGLLKKWGTNISNTLGMRCGDNPIMNWRGSVRQFTKRSFKHLNPDLITKTEIKKYGCYSCAIRCGGICQFKDPDSGHTRETHKPEYETINAFGGLLMNTDLESIYKINDLLNRAGMDSISAGGTIAFALECYEQGLITHSDTGGLELTWGNAEAITELVRQMIHRNGFGAMLADGTRQAAQRIGKGADRFAIHAGGQEPGMHDGRLDPQLGLHYCVDPTPGRHTIGSGLYYNMMQLWRFTDAAPKPSLLYPRSREFEPSEENAVISVVSSCTKMVLDGAGGCLFALISGLHNWQLFDYLNATTGWQKTADDYLLIGRRIQTLRQMFNIREGIDPCQNNLHPRGLGNPPQTRGPLKNKEVPINAMQRMHWRQFGWDEKSGFPLEKSIYDLGLTTLSV
ncbi:MAG TPA: aldehyde ferredoxin oxidoreductase [Anaerolineaceae bacterium]|nr:aldehyde ferredoxin oxidoreductase [Anaerolineaceae bacterium]